MMWWSLGVSLLVGVLAQSAYARTLLQGRTPVGATLSVVRAEGGLTANAVDQVVKRRNGQVGECMRGAGDWGRYVYLTFEIGPFGRPLGVTVYGVSHTLSTTTAQCLREALLGTAYPRSLRRTSVQVALSWVTAYRRHSGVLPVTLSRATIQAVIHQGIPRIQACYRRELGQHPSLGGQLVVAFTIDGQGRVPQAHPQGTFSAPRSPSFPQAAVSGRISACVTSVMRSLRFPAPAGGAALRVNYPFVFRTP